MTLRGECVLLSQQYEADHGTASEFKKVTVEGKERGVFDKCSCVAPLTLLLFIDFLLS